MQVIKFLWKRVLFWPSSISFTMGVEHQGCDCRNNEFYIFFCYTATKSPRNNIALSLLCQHRVSWVNKHSKDLVLIFQSRGWNLENAFRITSLSENPICSLNFTSCSAIHSDPSFSLPFFLVRCSPILLYFLDFPKFR